MNSRKRFRAEINNDYAQLVSSKKLRRFTTKNKLKTIDSNETHDSNPSIKLVTHIPNELIPKFRQVAKDIEPKNYSKPENWVQPEQAVVTSREEVIKAERDGVVKAVNTRLDYSRAARSLKIASDPNLSKAEQARTDQEVPMRNTHIDRSGKKVSLLKKFFAEANEKIKTRQ